MSHANYSIVVKECRPDVLVIRDEGPWDQHPTITNDAENVVELLRLLGHLPNHRALFYYDSDGNLTQLIHCEGKFLGFMPAEGHQL